MGLICVGRVMFGMGPLSSQDIWINKYLLGFKSVLFFNLTARVLID